MVNRFPLLNGDELDLDEQLSASPDFNADKTVRLRTDFAEESLPWWLSYQTDNGPASPTFDGLATSGGGTTVSLDTGATSSGDTTALAGPTINWDNWREVRIYAWGATVDVAEARVRVHLSDNKDPNEITEGFKIGTFEDQNISGRVVSGGTANNDYNNRDYGGLQTLSYGFRIYENPTGNGHSIDFNVEGQHEESWAEAKGWAAAQDLTVYLSAVTTDGTQAIATFDGVIVELVPY